MTEVLQIDRVTAGACARYFGHDFTACEVEAGEADNCSLVTIVAAHRIAGQAELASLILALLGNVNHDRPGGSNDAAMRGGLLESIREAAIAALQPLSQAGGGRS